jgi:hypothetical protein
LLLGDQVEEVIPGNFSKRLMPYFLNHHEVDFDSVRNTLEGNIRSNYWLQVLQGSYVKNCYQDFAYTDVDVSLLPDLQMYLDAGEVGALTDVLVGVAMHADGKKDIPQRLPAVANVTADLLANLLDRRDIAGSDIQLMMENGDIQPKPFWECDFYLDHVVLEPSENFISKVRENMASSFPENDVFWKIKDKLTDAQIFNAVHTHDSKGPLLESWVAGMVAFKELTGNDITIREALATKPSRYFRLSKTEPFMDLLDENPQSGYDFLRPDVSVSEPVLDKEEGVFTSTLTIESPSIFHEHVEQALGQKSLAFPEIRGSRTGFDFVEFELEFDSETSRQEINQVNQKIKLSLLKTFKELMEDTPVPGDVVQMAVDEDLDEEEINDLGAPGFRVGDQGKVVAAYASGASYSFKVEGIYHYFEADELEVFHRPALKKMPEPETDINLA